MISELLKKRCSIRKFNSKKISDELIDLILESGRLSPSGGNEQPWKFGVITDTELINQIAELSYNQLWIKTSPLLIVLCATIIEDDLGAKSIQNRRFPRYEKEIALIDKDICSCLNLEEHQTKIPGTHMALCALEIGIYSTWISCFDIEKVAKLLRTPHNCIPSEILAFGYPENELIFMDKKSIEELTFHNYYIKDER